jgi:hypothetical protein
MTTFTTEDREALEKGLDFFKELKGEPIPFAGWVSDKEDTGKTPKQQYEEKKEAVLYDPREEKKND